MDFNLYSNLLNDLRIKEEMSYTKQVFEFLENLRDSGAINMMGATPYLMEAFDIDKKTARELLLQWMNSKQNV